MTFETYINQICWMSLRGVKGADAVSIDNWFPVAESLCPTIFQQVGEKAAGDERKRSLLKQSTTVTVANGVATLDDFILTAYMEDSGYLDTSDLSKTYSWVREWFDFINPNLDPRLGYYSMKQGVTLNQREPNTLYDPSAGFSGTMLLNVPCAPVVPTSASATIDVVDEVLNDLLDTGSALLRGEMAKAALAQT